jgi:hypothetical protein
VAIQGELANGIDSSTQAASEAPRTRGHASAATYNTGRPLRRAAAASILLALLAAIIGGTINLPMVAMNALLYAELIALLAANTFVLIDIVRPFAGKRALSREQAANAAAARSRQIEEAA